MKQLVSVVALGFVVGCAAAEAGPAKTEPRQVGSFKAIDVRNALDVELVIGKAASVKVTGDADVVGKVKTIVDRGILKLYLDDPNPIVISMDDMTITQSSVTSNNRPRVVVTAPDVSEIEVSGASRVNASGLSNAKLELTLSGASSVKIVGSTKVLAIEVSGASSLDAQQLSATTAAVQVSGASRATVAARDAVTASASGASKVTVYGKPATVTRSASGASKITMK
ncbi:MAG: DUF2807 domain-containing protein [Kofleriaceae bacterium]